MAWRAFAATAIGKAHIDAGTPCQDAVCVRVLGEVLIAVVCDGAVSRDYGVLIEEKGIALRGTFIIDPEGILRYALYHDLGVGRRGLGATFG